MTALTRQRSFGWRVYGFGIIALAVVSLVWGGFDPGQPVPKNFPGRAVLAHVVAAFMLVAGLCLQSRRTAAWGAAALTAYYTLIVVIVMGGPGVLAHPAQFGTYSNIAEQLAIAAGGLIVYATFARIEPALAARVTRIGRATFAICALLFGGAHFVYMNLTAPLVPNWLPPSQIFWGYATGIGFIAAGIAILSGIQSRLAVVLLTVMFAFFALLVHARMLLAEPSNHGNWAEAALNLTVLGVSWVVADSLARTEPPT